MILAPIGALAWPLLGKFLPSLSPKLTLAFIGGLLALLLMGGPALGVYIHMSAQQSTAIRLAKLEQDKIWKDQLDQEKTRHEWIVADAIAHAESVVVEDAPAARPGPELDRLCNADAYCRDRNKKRR